MWSHVSGTVIAVTLRVYGNYNIVVVLFSYYTVDPVIFNTLYFH